MLKAINIISFDVPFPANYGGVIDVFYKLKYFHQKGIEVHLHYFEYGRGEQEGLKKYCASVNYYKRKTGLVSILSSLPYIVKSRESRELKKNLLKNDFPILFEGLHTCFLLDDQAFNSRLKIVRSHNVEHDYYHQLALVEKNLLKRMYYQKEAIKLQGFESVIAHANYCLPISSKDFNYFEKQYPTVDFKYIPAFHANEDVLIKKGKGEYVLYHGNLSVVENDHAAQYIISEIFKESEIPLIIAGLNPSETLKKLIASHEHIRLVANPTDEEMRTLIVDAQINLLHTEQATGLKLKLLNVLFNGRFCMVNSKMLEGTSLTKACIVENEPKAMINAIKTIFEQEINAETIEKRKELLKIYSNEHSFEEMIKCF